MNLRRIYLIDWKKYIIYVDHAYNFKASSLHAPFPKFINYRIKSHYLLRLRKQNKLTTRFHLHAFGNMFDYMKKPYI